MVDLAEIQAAYYMVAATGVLVAAIYYIQNMRLNEKIRRRDMVFQKTNINTFQLYDIIYDVARMTDWETLEEFQRKYDYWVNPEAYKKFITLMNYYNCLGILLRDGIVSADQVFQLNSAGFLIRICETFKPWIDIQGITDDYFGGLKYLYDEARRLYPNTRPGKLTRSLEERVNEAKQRANIVKASKK